MAVVAVQAIRRMRGGSQSQLLLDTNSQLWVVKFQNNPQGIRILANEWIVTRLAETIGLPAPTAEIVVVPKPITNDPEMYIELPRLGRQPYLPGEHYGSKFAGGLMPGFVVDYLPESGLTAIRNPLHFAGVLALDKWTANGDGRQAIFHRSSQGTRYTAMFIDHGFCFNGCKWDFPDAPLRGVYGNNAVYKNVTGWSSFEPWLSRIENMEAVTLWEIAASVPSIWCGEQPNQLKRLVDQLIARRERVRELIAAFRDSDRMPFPSWGSVEESPGQD